MHMVGPIPLTTTHSLPSGGVNARRPKKAGAYKSGLHRAVPGATDPPKQPSAVISMSESESSDGEVRLAAATSTPSLAAPVSIPSLIGNGDHIFPVPGPRPPSGPAPPTNTVTMTNHSEFDRYKHLIQYRGPHTEDATIFHPAEGDIGDGDGWYYVTVGRNVGVFNSW